MFDAKGGGRRLSSRFLTERFAFASWENALGKRYLTWSGEKKPDGVVGLGES